MGLFNMNKEAPRFGSWLDVGLQTGLTLALSVTLFTLGGVWLDGKLQVSPLFTIIGVLWGAGGGIWWLVIRVKQFSEAQEKAERESGASRNSGEGGSK